MPGSLQGHPLEELPTAIRSIEEQPQRWLRCTRFLVSSAASTHLIEPRGGQDGMKNKRYRGEKKGEKPIVFQKQEQQEKVALKQTT